MRFRSDWVGSLQRVVWSCEDADRTSARCMDHRPRIKVYNSQKLGFVCRKRGLGRADLLVFPLDELFGASLKVGVLSLDELVRYYWERLLPLYLAALLVRTLLQQALQAPTHQNSLNTRRRSQRQPPALCIRPNNCVPSRLQETLYGRIQRAAAAGVDSRAAGVDSRAAGVDSRVAGVDSRAAGVDSSAAGVDSRAAGVDSRAAG
eukprot:1195314-Prorocentrum_minimum.AAC.5